MHVHSYHVHTYPYMSIHVHTCWFDAVADFRIESPVGKIAVLPVVLPVLESVGEGVGAPRPLPRGVPVLPLGLELSPVGEIQRPFSVKP